MSFEKEVHSGVVATNASNMWYGTLTCPPPVYDLCTWQVRRLERGGSCAAEGRTCHSSAFIAAVPHAAELIFVQVTGIALGNNGCMASAGEDGTVRIWEVTSHNSCR